MARCIAKKKGSRLQCGNSALPGKPTCRFHGGNTPLGAWHPNYKTGKYCSGLPGRLWPSYQQALQDHELTSVRNELALIDLRLTDLIKKLEKSDGMLNLELLTGLAAELKRTIPPDTQQYVTVELLEKVAASGWEEKELWEQITDLTENRRKLAETEVRRMTALQQTLPIGKVLGIIQAVAESVRTSVLRFADRETANNILREASRSLSGIVSAASGEAAHAGIGAEGSDNS